MSSGSTIGKSSIPSGLSLRISEAIGHEFVMDAPAKLNLRLKVEGRRSDGYHLLSMINCSLSLSDTVRFSLVEGARCSVTVVPPDVISQSGENLVERAFKAFWREFGFTDLPCGLDCTIEKRIPVGGGMGGGSADAGAVFRQLDALFKVSLCEQLGISHEEYRIRLNRAALSCGADVPYAFVGGLCLVQGIGEIVTQLSLPSLSPTKALIVVPSQPVPTAAFYELYRKTHPTIPPWKDELIERFRLRGDGDLTALVENDFEATACQMVPAIADGLKVIREVFPRGAALTGSGSVFFCLVPERDEGAISELSGRLQEQGFRTYLCSLIFS